MLYGSSSFSQFAMNKELEFPPGSHWKYSSGTSNLVARLLHDRVGGDLVGTRAWIEAKLFAPLNLYGLHRGRPFWRFGWLKLHVCLGSRLAEAWSVLLSDGTVDGMRLVPEDWLTAMAQPVSNAPQGKYGFHTWLNAGGAADPSDRLFRLCRARLSSFEGTMTSL